MRARLLICAAAAIVVAALLSVSTSGQAPARGTTEKPYSVGRTPWGHPDLQGVYDVQTLTPLERPKDSTGVALTKEEADRIARAERDRVTARAQPSDPNRPLPKAGGGVGGYNDFWMDRGQSGFVIDGQYRTSIIIDPADGRVPARTAEGELRNRRSRGTASLPTSDALENIQPDGAGAYDDIELRPFAERCILAFGSIVRTSDSAELLLQQPQADRADAQYGGAVHRDGPRRAHHPVEQPAPARTSSILDGRLHRPLGRRHAGRRDDQLHQQDAIPRLVREPEGHRAVQPPRRRHASLQVHG